MEFWEQHNSNYAVYQAGSEGASDAGVVLGALDGLPTKHDYLSLRTVFMGAGSPDHVALFDDFVGNAVLTAWLLTQQATGTPSGTHAIVAAQRGGVSRLTTDTEANTDYVSLAAGLNWYVGAGRLFFEARIRPVAAADLVNVKIEVGLSDATSETGGSAAANGLAFSDHVTPTAVATNALIFGFQEGASDTTNWKVLGVNAGTITAADSGGSAPAAETWVTLGIVVDANGTARFYINGTLVHTETSAIATTALLTPWISIKNYGDTNANALDIDYILIAGSR